MSNFMLDWQSIATFIVNYLLHSTLLLVGCWAFFAVTRIDSHFLVERLWKLAAVLGILTAAFQVWLPAMPPAHVDLSVAQGTARSDTIVLYDDLSARDPEIVPPYSSLESQTPITFHLAESPGPALANPNATDVAAANNPRSHAWLPDLSPFVMVAICGFVVLSVAVGALMALWHTYRFRQYFSDVRPLQSETAQEALRRLLKRAGIHRKVRLMESPRQSEPVAFGLLHWTIVLPPGIEERLEPVELDALLAHEVAHLVRGDVWWLWLGRGLCTCFAIQPLNLLARRRWQHAAEYLCDEWAVESGVESLSLARCLTKIAEWRLHDGSTAFVSTEFGLAASGSKSTLLQRVERLVSSSRTSDRWQKPQRRRLINLTAIACMVMVTAFAPRVALPVDLEGSDAVESQLQTAASIEAWANTEEELVQLEADLDRAIQLLESNLPGDEAAELVQSFRKRMESLQFRRTRVRSFIERNQR